MALIRRSREETAAFAAIAAVGMTLPDVELATRYDGSPVLRVGGAFMAGLASHESAEPGTLVVRSAAEDRRWLLEDAPETYYLTDYYRKHPVVLARVARLDREALHDLLSVSRRLTLSKARGRVEALSPEPAKAQGPRSKAGVSSLLPARCVRRAPPSTRR